MFAKIGRDGQPKPLDPSRVRRQLSQFTTGIGIGHWHPHELRHSAASFMLSQGVPLYVVSEVMGHSSITVTKDIYGHLLGHEAAKAIEATSGMLLGPENAVRFKWVKGKKDTDPFGGQPK